MPETRYAKSGDVHIAYQVVGDGPMDLVLVPGFTSHLDMAWEPPMEHVTQRLASFSRLILFDKRGTGLSDPIDEPPPLEVRMDDVRAVMDAAGSERAALLGNSEGGAMALLFAATYPERTRALVTWGAMARTTYAPDYAFAPTYEAYSESASELILPYWGGDMAAEMYTPSRADDSTLRAWQAKQGRLGASPGMLLKIVAMYLDVDVREAAATVAVPTLVIHAHGDYIVNVRHGRWLAEHIPGAKYVELPGIDHFIWITDPDRVIDEIQEFLTGVRPVTEPDRVLATVMFTDIVSSTERAAELGDHRWHEVLDLHHAAIRKELDRFRGVEVKTTGDGFLATFDGPARAIRCGRAIVDAVRPLGLAVKVGVHSGEVERMGSDVAGIAVHIASRVGALAAPGEVLVSETVKGLVAGSGIAFTERGEHELKGVPDRWRLFAAQV
jgi:pimeloyl-ACP methyl ester carboxylesterase/class 3 adenylate cyclase